jgi:hypothetical protein
VLIVTTADEHRVALAMLRVALGLTPGDVETILGGDPGWVIAYESGEAEAVGLYVWNGWVQCLAVGYCAKLHAAAAPEELHSIADSLLTLAAHKEAQ